MVGGVSGSTAHIDTSQLTEEVLKMKQAGAKKKKEEDLKDMFDNMQISIVGGQEEEEKFTGPEEDEDSDQMQDQEEHFKEDPNLISQKHTKHTTLEERDREDMDFPDEVDTPLKDARKRFQKYRGVKSLKNCEWDPYENLPVEYSKIFRFQNTQAELKQQRDLAVSEGLPLHGTYLTLVLEVESEATFEELESLKQDFLILSTLYPHECKVSTMHFRLRRSYENNEIVPSKSLVEFSCGFRRLAVKPTFSKEINPTGKNDKMKYMRFFRKDVDTIATAYCPIIYSQCKVIAFTRKDLVTPISTDLLAQGIALQPDPLKIILKRIILTGYPLKVAKKRATIRYMFFDPKDIKYFKPVELQTTNGLRGHIKDSLGTHGLMKCYFNDFIKHSDVVCMPLFRRVYPKWFEGTWDPTKGDEAKMEGVEMEEEDN
mmetsp:Transcript_12923/g.21870  ORF Transcript_12923/g.21870 Transcript_12923/m.21870 type:complete len:429 (-) Transcript_12923:32-1318(-)